MSFVNKVKKQENVYDIHDSRLEVTSGDIGKLVGVDSEGNLALVNAPAGGTKWYLHTISFRGIEDYNSTIKAISPYRDAIAYDSHLLPLLTNKGSVSVNLGSGLQPFILIQSYYPRYNNNTYEPNPLDNIVVEKYCLAGQYGPIKLLFVHKTLTTDGSTISVTSTTDTSCSLTDIVDTVTEL